MNMTLKDFQISYKKTLKALPAPWDPTNLNQYRVTLSRYGRSLSFNYWVGSLSEFNLNDALYHYFLDIDIGGDTFGYFCNCWGYNNDSIKDHKIWLSMRRSHNKFVNIFSASNEDIINIVEELQAIQEEE